MEFPVKKDLILLSLVVMATISSAAMAKVVTCNDKQGKLYLKADYDLVSRDLKSVEVFNPKAVVHMQENSLQRTTLGSKTYKFKQPVRFWFVWKPNFTPGFWDTVLGGGADEPHPVFGKSDVDVYQNRGFWEGNEFQSEGVYISTKKDALSTTELKLDLSMNHDIDQDSWYELPADIHVVLDCKSAK